MTVCVPATSPKKLCVYVVSIDARRRYHEKALGTRTHFLMSPRTHSQNDSLNFAHTRNVLCWCMCCVCGDILEQKSEKKKSRRSTLMSRNSSLDWINEINNGNFEMKVTRVFITYFIYFIHLRRDFPRNSTSLRGDFILISLPIYF